MTGHPAFFTSQETELLSLAFEKAWLFVEYDHTLGPMKVNERRSALARTLMHLLKSGETDAIRLANDAIDRVRAGSQDSDARVAASAADRY